MSHPGTPHEFSQAAGSFQPTRWSLVAVAARRGSAQSNEALDHLCRIYWYPLYCYIRRRGYSPDDAQDLVQGFFTRLLQKDFFQEAEPTKGRLRGFLISSLQYYLLDERKRAAAAKRGGEIDFVPIDTSDAEARYSEEADDAASPYAAFEKRWALTVVQRAADTLAAAWEREGKGAVFAALRPFLLSPMDAAAAREVGPRVKMTENHLKVSLHRLRERFGVVLRQEVAETVDSEEAVEDELAAIRAALS